jgi:5-methylcytosine-specific restriction protein A
MGLRTLRPRVGLANLNTATPPAKVADPFYLSSAWIALRDRVRREAGGRCQAPGCGRADRRMYADHIIELKDGGGPLDRTNVWLLCPTHHALKTAAERATRTACRPGEGGLRSLGPLGAPCRRGPHAQNFFRPANTTNNGP